MGLLFKLVMLWAIISVLFSAAAVLAVEGFPTKRHWSDIASHVAGEAWRVFKLPYTTIKTLIDARKKQ